MTKRKKVIITSCASIVLAAVVMFVLTFGLIFPLISNHKYTTPKVKAFGSLEEISNFVAEKAEEQLTPDKDSKIKNLEFAESAAYKIKFNGKTYEIYTYVFNTHEDAYKYFRNSGGANPTMYLGDYSVSISYFIYTKLMVCKGCGAYRIEGPGGLLKNEVIFYELIGALNLYLTEEFL